MKIFVIALFCAVMSIALAKRRSFSMEELKDLDAERADALECRTLNCICLKYEGPPHNCRWESATHTDKEGYVITEHVCNCDDVEYSC